MRPGGVARVGGDFVVLSLVCGVSAFSVWFATFPRSKFGLVGASALAKSFSCSKIGLVVASVRNSPRKRGVRLCEGARVVLGMCG